MVEDHDAAGLTAAWQAAAPLLNWQLAPAATLVWHAWEGEVVAYASPSASTHLLNEASSAVFLALSEAGPEGSSEPRLLDSLGEASADDDSAAELRQLRDILDSLQRSGLAESRAA